MNSGIGAIHTAAIQFVPIVLSGILTFAVTMIMAVLAGVRWHEISDEGKKMDTIVENIHRRGWNSHVVFVNNKMIPVGWVCGWHPFVYFGFVTFEKNENGVTQNVKVWCTEGTFTSMMLTSAREPAL